MAKKNNEVNEEMNISIPVIETATFSIKIEGQTPLIMHKWSEKAKKEMLDVQMKKASKGKQAKNPVYDYVQSMYIMNPTGVLADVPDDIDYETAQEALEKAVFGFPASAFKAAALDAGFQQGFIQKKTTMRGAFFVRGDAQNGEMVTIHGTPNMREDMVKIGGMTKVADIRYRGEIQNWSATLTIEYLKSSITPEQIISLINIGGICNGVGEWRPARDGVFGTYRVISK